MAARLSSIKNGFSVLRANQTKVVNFFNSKCQYNASSTSLRREYSDISCPPSSEDWSTDNELITSEDSYNPAFNLKSLSNPDTVLEPPKCEGIIDLISDPPRKTYNLAAYANTLPVIQKLVELQVPIYRWDENPSMAKFVMKSNFEEHFEPFIKLFVEAGVPDDKLGTMVAKFRMGFSKFTVKEIEERLNYLSEKKFTKEMVGSIVSRVPTWLFHSAEKIDRHLGKIQKLYDLCGKEVRMVVHSDPTFVLHSIKNVVDLELPALVFANEMFLNKVQMKELLIAAPKIFRLDRESVVRRFTFLTETMGYEKEVLLQSPLIFDFRETKMRERHGFLKLIKKDQYNHQKANFITPSMFVSGTDDSFAQNVCKTNPKMFDDYLRTL